MTFAANVELYKSKPIAIIEIALDGGTEYYSNHDIEISTGAAIRFYSGRVLSFGSISRSVSDIEGNFQISDVTTTFDNSDGKFSAYDAETFFNRIVTYKLGFDGDDLTAFENKYVGRIYDFEFVNDTLVLQVKDLTTTLLEQDFGHYVEALDWPRANVGVMGSKMPIIYGAVKGEAFAEGQTIVSDAVEFESSLSFDQCRVAYDPVQNRHLVMWYNSDGDGFIRAGYVSGSTITYGTAVEFGAGSNIYGVALAYSTEDDEFLCVYTTDTPELNAFTVSLSGSVITKSADTLVDNAADLEEGSTHADSRLEIVYDDKADRFLIMYYSKTPSLRVRARAVSISAGISAGAQTTVSAGADAATSFAISYDQSLNHTLMFWNETTGLTGRAASISNLTITLGSEVTLDAAAGVAGQASYDPITGNTLLPYVKVGVYYATLVKTVVDVPELVGTPSIIPTPTNGIDTIYDSNANIFIIAQGHQTTGLSLVGAKIVNNEIDFTTSTTLIVDNSDYFSTNPAIVYDLVAKKTIACYYHDTVAPVYSGRTKLIDTSIYKNYYIPTDGISGVKCTALDIQGGIWLVAGHKVHAIGNVFTTDNANDQDLPKYRGTDLTKTLAYTYAGGFENRIAIITFTGTLPQDNDTVWCDVDGFETSGNVLIENPIEMLEHFITEYMDFTSDEYNTTTFGVAETEADTRGYIGAGVIELGSNETARSIVESMARSFGATIAYDADGKLTIKFQA